MNRNVQVKLHPERPIYSTIPDQLPSGNWVIGYETHLQIEGQYVLKFKITMMARNGNTSNVEYIHKMDVQLGFRKADVESEAHFYYLCNYCYQTAIIEFNKSLDNLKSKESYMDARFESEEDIKKKVDNAMNPEVN